MKRLALIPIFFSLAACISATHNYVKPTSQASRPTNFKTIDKPRDAVWNASIAELSKRFFVINNIDKSSGLINISYSGDPEKYIDCGRVTSSIKSLRGERNYDFPGSKAQQSYEVSNGLVLINIDRKMSLEGRINLLFEELSPTQTRITASTKYIVKRHITALTVGYNIPQHDTESITFNSGGSDSFSQTLSGNATECAATSALEAEILSNIK